MQTPQYVLRIEEGVLIPKQSDGKTDVIRKAVYIIIFILIAGSLIFQENLFGELSTITQILLIGLVIKFVFSKNDRMDVPSPIELQFFTDYLILYRPKRYYSKRVTRREYNTMKYNEITRIKYVADTRMFHFYGNFEAEYFNFKKDGTIEENPGTHRMIEEGMLYFSTKCTDDDDNEIMRTLSRYIPVKIDIV